jgi:hypothetical protein
MSDQIILAWTVSVANSSFGPLQAAAALSSVELYKSEQVDPILGQFFGLGVTDDQTTNDATSATRTLTLNMTPADGEPFGPPLFPCHPRTSDVNLESEYRLVQSVTLPGSFFVELGSAIVDTAMTQFPSLVAGDEIQFLNQQGVFYEVLSIDSATQITLTDPFTGTTGNTGAFKEVAAPCSLELAAVYSSSDLDTNGLPTVPEILPGAGARIVEMIYDDSVGGGPFTATAELTGKRPAPFDFGESGGQDIAVIFSLNATTVGGFGNDIGEITVVELFEPVPDLPPNLPLGTGVGAAEAIARTFKTMTDEAQILIGRHLVYLPPSYFALANPQASAPALSGDFLVTTNSLEVFTEEDQTGALSANDLIEFAVQPGTIYTIAAITPEILKLTTIFTGIDTNNTGLNNTPNNNTSGTKGNIGDALQKKPTGARSPSITATPPSNDQLAGPLAQFVAPGVAAPPPNPKHTVAPGTMTPATTGAAFLSNLFTQTIQLALAGVPVTAQPITFA